MSNVPCSLNVRPDVGEDSPNAALTVAHGASTSAGNRVAGRGRHSTRVLPLGSAEA